MQHLAQTSMTCRTRVSGYDCPVTRKTRVSGYDYPTHLMYYSVQKPPNTII